MPHQIILPELITIMLEGRNLPRMSERHITRVNTITSKKIHESIAFIASVASKIKPHNRPGIPSDSFSTIRKETNLINASRLCMFQNRIDDIPA
jgi:hypothetical protein